VHPMVRDALYGELGLARARQRHARVAESLERFYGIRARGHSAELAFHFSRANASDLTPKAILYLAAAGRTALERHANREAAAYLDTALELADRSGSEVANAAGVAPLVDELARARQRLGEYDAALALWGRALADAERAGEHGRRASIERRMGLASYWRGRHADALAHYERGIAATDLAGDDRLAARLHMAAGVVHLELGRPADAERETRLALAIAERRGDAALAARAQRALLLLYVWTGEPEPARAHGARAIELAREAEELSVEWSAHWALALVGGLTGNSAETERHLRESERLADELHSPVMRAWTAEIAIEVASAKGEWDAALALAERTVEVTRALGQRAILPRVLVWTGILSLARGEQERGKELVDEAWELSGAARASDASGRHVDVHTVVPAHTGRATYHLTIGDYDEAIRVGRAGLAIADRSGYVVWGIYRLLPVIAEAALRKNDLATAQWVGERLRRDSERLGHALGLAWADACDALVATLGGDAERGVVVLRAAAEALEAIPFVADAARLRRELGYRLNTVGDRDGALRELRAAHDVFLRLGAAPELATAREQIRDLGARPPTRPSAPGAAGLTPRELEIARLVASRKSNKEIGKALDISARTVSTHLSNIFTKVGVTSRGELADFARERLSNES
ncbi:MAG: LuxR C-terminal-related transcriptional regulator, partial [Gemmatimonadaceae bacterium]